MLKSRLLASVNSELPGNLIQVSRTFTMFTGHAGRHDLAWNIRIPYICVSREEIGTPYGRWVENNQEILDEHFNEHCQIALNDVLEYISEQFPNDKLNFEQQGRSGGWLVLTSATINGEYYDFCDRNDSYPVAEKIMYMSRNTLIKFRRMLRVINEECSEDRRAGVAAWIEDWYHQLFEDSLISCE